MGQIVQGLTKESVGASKYVPIVQAVQFVFLLAMQGPEIQLPGEQAEHAEQESAFTMSEKLVSDTHDTQTVLDVAEQLLLRYAPTAQLAQAKQGAHPLADHVDPATQAAEPLGATVHDDVGV